MSAPLAWERAWKRACAELTQLGRAAAARQKLQDLFPQIAEAKEELQRVLAESDDGTIDETKWKQLSSVVKGANDLLISLLFWSDKQ
jgi:hypothetical protein